MFDAVLVANRGEIACRIISALSKMGLRSIAVYSDADADARHVRLADEAVRLGPAPAAQSYLSITRIIDAAIATGAQAIHPGYGFLAENPGLARACIAGGIVFIGPSPKVLEVMGDKIRAKAQAAARGVPVVPGTGEEGLSDADLISRAADVGLPLLIKPSAGGGGKGMHVVRSPEELPETLGRARREAEGSFGSGELLIERLIPRPRHIEVQILADRAGHTIHLGERECSLQRRHQKIIEEAPSPLLEGTTRERMGAAAIEVARSVGYEGAGTVEFIVAGDSPEEFFFMEMNTRLQVEHPVTEMVTGIDLVSWQIRIASGEALDIRQGEVALGGHAIEARVYAEDPARGFLPTGGRVLELVEPTGEGIRVDSALLSGLEITADYDPMLAKIIAHGPTRAAALHRLDRALADTAILGVGTNVEFLRKLLAHPAVRTGDLDTGLVDRAEPATTPPDDHALATAALIAARELRGGASGEGPPGPGAWARGDGWRLGAPVPLRIGFDTHPPVFAAGPSGQGSVTIGDGVPVPASLHLEGATARATYGGVTRTYTFACDAGTVHLARGGITWELTSRTHTTAPDTLPGATDPELRSPMPGTVTVVHAGEGEVVDEGEAVVVVEAMKMEHVLHAPHKGRVRVRASPGEQVAANQVLATVTPDEEGVDE